MQPISLTAKTGTRVGALCLLVLELAGCSVTASRLGPDATGLQVGQEYELRRDVILLANRGYRESLESPDHRIEDYKPYEDYDPYYQMPMGVLPVGTVILIKEVRLFSDDRFRVLAEIKSGRFATETHYGVSFARKVVINRIVGGKSFDFDEFRQNLSPQTAGS